MRAPLFGLLVSTAAAAQQPAATITVESTGEYAIAPLARDAALAAEQAIERAKQQALRGAVEKASGVFLQADSQTRNNALVLDRVVTNASGYIKSFEVTSKVVEKGVAKVTVKAVVANDTLEKDIKAARGIVGRLLGSKLLVVMQEQLMDDKGVASRSEYLPTALTNKFKEAGFQIIDEKGTGSSDLNLVLSSGIGQGKLDAKEIAKRSDADFIIYGTANVRYVPPDPKATMGYPEVDPVTGKQVTFFVTGDYDLSMFATRTGQQLSKQSGRLNVNYASKSEILVSYQRTASFAVEASSKTVVSSFFGSVFEWLRDQDVNGAKLTVRVGGIVFDDVEDVEKSLAVVEGVKDLKAGEFADGTQDFVVQFMGNAGDFSKALKNASIKKRKLVVTAVRNNLVEVTVAK